MCVYVCIGNSDISECNRLNHRYRKLVNNTAHNTDQLIAKGTLSDSKNS